MKIRFLTSVATNLRAFERKEEVEWPDDKDAKRLIAAGYAEPVEQSKNTEPKRG